MGPQVRRRLRDVIYFIEELETVLPPGISYEALAEDVVRIRAVERCLEITGEALVQTRRAFPELPISDLAKIVSLRNRLAHEYTSISVPGIYKIVRESIPNLKREVEELLAG